MFDPAVIASIAKLHFCRIAEMDACKFAHRAKPRDGLSKSKAFQIPRDCFIRRGGFAMTAVSFIPHLTRQVELSARKFSVQRGVLRSSLDTCCLTKSCKIIHTLGKKLLIIPM
jgi:hypothetical protein